MSSLRWDMGGWDRADLLPVPAAMMIPFSPLSSPPPTAPQTPCAELPIHRPTLHAWSCRRARGGVGGGFPPRLQPHVPVSVPPAAPIAGCSASPVRPSRCVRLSSCRPRSRGSSAARSSSPRAHPVGPRALRRLPPLPDVPGRSQLTWKQPRLQHTAVGPLSPPHGATPGSPSHPFPVPTWGGPLARRSCRKPLKWFQGLHHRGTA